VARLCGQAGLVTLTARFRSVPLAGTGQPVQHYLLSRLIRVSGAFYETMRRPHHHFFADGLLLAR
jgi:hypothetical protein